MALPPKWYQFLISVFASLGSLLYGYDLGVIAEAIACASFTTKFNPTDNETGAVVSVFTGGAFFGAAAAGPIGDILGAQSLAYLYSGRAIAGLGVGALVMIVPLYQAELAHPSIRVGALAAAWISYGTYIGFAPNNSAQWRVSLGIQTIPAAILALLILFFPESPRWLIDHGKPDEGLRTLAKLHAHAKSYMELFTDRSCFRRLFLACSIQASVQMTGVSAIQYFSVSINSQMGITGNDTLKYQAISSVIALIAQFLCILFIDHTGRRWPLILGNLGNMAAFIIATILLATFPPGTSHNNAASSHPHLLLLTVQHAAWGFIVITWIYNFSFSATCGPLSWIIPAEIFDTRTRSKGVSIATTTSFAFNTMIGQVTKPAMTHIRYRFYFLFIICNLTNAIFFWAILPETAKRPLEEMNYLFTNAPLFVPTVEKAGYQTHDLERRVEEVERKQSYVAHVEKS
ncbi:general substrate transporter [Glonium stellatum]|uniref:General substrate transporter n=1 Tax=Glonium stellatum TaxID=574774 RepID=A0A8E2JPG5_9PEZI|nr:general substrate transporter [Glonium stellatum]